jgi:hypothetical protein
VPTARFALERDGPKRLEIRWGLGWGLRTVVTLDGKEIGSIPGRKELKEGRLFPLEDGSTLSVQSGPNLITQEFRVLRDGRPLPGSASDPAQRLRVASGVLLVIGGLSIAVGLVAELFRVQQLMQRGIGLGSMIEGVVYVLLAVLARRRSVVALGIAVALMVLDLVVGLAGPRGVTPSYGGVIVRVLLLVTVSQGFGAIRALKSAEA